MKKTYLFLITLLSFIPLNSALAKGGGGSSWLLGIDLSYLSSKTETDVSGTTATAETATTFYDISFGKMLGANIFLGALYSTSNDKTTGASVSTTTSGSATGASLGYIFDSGVFLTATYLLSATYDDYKKGTGYQIDLGWRSFLSSSFFVGAKLATRSIKYTENETISGFNSLTTTSTMPYISLGFGF